MQVDKRQILKMLSEVGIKPLIVGKPTANNKKILVMAWDEYEKGYGTRPDGYSLHTNDANFVKYFNETFYNETEYYSSDPTGFYEEYVPRDIYMQISKHGGTLVVDKLFW